MEFSTAMNASDNAKVTMQVDSFNKALNGSKAVKQNLDKDDFMKILITQLSHQDPTKPMEDKEFIAQMAQFSSLEQMTNMNQQFTNVAERLNSSQAFNVLGQDVELMSGGQAVKGTVEAVTGGEYPQLLIDGNYYDFDTLQTVFNSKGESQL
ncbi:MULTISPECIES: flagellar hook assembly protein FlgD [unclassified Oceanispirochaeta]|uniref:flagellar hook assembly protein FlgD n=1 Tax=unclassified Oceanispirochaeta TaxID=2635722 RepID=UPI000E09288F|nr:MULTISPECIES: flagellar hook assembly protein FlgD [unclassified Oceanispirochaeta]MBF9016157.1 flagellar hook assembly protein FlgD [Oceanispirochaeta sp. M2]NPD72619.1 flagellar hook assembly protein FlgD [Oceanispirochaeta sp. M1]RDG31770.1 flagellar hook assembly protein FlgD [Oceanispirochaeta sp. M1]